MNPGKLSAIAECLAINKQSITHFKGIISKWHLGELIRMTYCSSKTTPEVRKASPEIGVYECEVKLKFRILEEDLTRCDREQLLQILVDAFSYGSDEYLESVHSEVSVNEVSALDASPEMRRQLIRLRNASHTR